MKRKTEVLN